MFYYFLESFPHHIENKYSNDYKVSTSEDDDIIVDSAIENEYVRIEITYQYRNDIDVCVIGNSSQYSTSFYDVVRARALENRKRYPTAPIIIAGNHAEKSHNPEFQRDAQLAGDKMINQKIGNKIAQEFGAVKYIEFAWESERGAKILIDEIAFAGLCKFKKAEERKEKAIKRESKRQPWNKAENDRRKAYKLSVTICSVICVITAIVFGKIFL